MHEKIFWNFCVYITRSSNWNHQTSTFEVLYNFNLSFLSTCLHIKIKWMVVVVGNDQLQNKPPALHNSGYFTTRCQYAGIYLWSITASSSRTSSNHHHPVACNDQYNIMYSVKCFSMTKNPKIFSIIKSRALLTKKHLYNLRNIKPNGKHLQMALLCNN